MKILLVTYYIIDLQMYDLLIMKSLIWKFNYSLRLLISWIFSQNVCNYKNDTIKIVSKMKNVLILYNVLMFLFFFCFERTYSYQ